MNRFTGCLYIALRFAADYVPGCGCCLGLCLDKAEEAQNKMEDKAQKMQMEAKFRETENVVAEGIAKMETDVQKALEASEEIRKKNEEALKSASQGYMMSQSVFQNIGNNPEIINQKNPY